jgi:hypothetical protein
MSDDECQTTNETVGTTNENEHDSQYIHPTEVQTTNHIENIYENDDWEEGEIREGQQTVTEPTSKPTTMAAVTAATTTVTAVTATKPDETKTQTSDIRKVVLKKNRGSWKQ